LTKPQDGRLSNYILHEQNLFCIDNDLAFVEPVTKSGPFRKVHFSASPFCLFPLTTPLDQEVLEEFAALDTVGICKAWVEEIIEKEKEYLQLFTEQERKALYEEEGCTLNLLLREGTFSTLNLQFWQLQNTIQAAINQHKILTAGDLLQELVSLAEEKVGNYVYRAYNNTKATPEEKQQVALQRKQDSSVTAVEYHKNCLGKIPNFSEIEKLKKYSLEKASQELFHAFLIESEHAYLKDSQGKSALGANFKALKDSTREAKILLSINEFMKRSPQKILSLSFYYSTLLDKRKMESFLHPSLEKIDLRYCSNIDNDTIWLIQEKCPHLKEMTVIGCPKITNLGKRLFSSKLNFAHLKILEISHTPCTTLAFTARELNALNISYNLELIELDFEAPFLLEINAKKSEKIRLSPSARQDSIQAFARTPKTLATVPMLLVNEQEFLKNIIFKNGLALEYADTSLRNDTEVVLVAVKQNGLALQYASEELKSDREFVLAAVKQNGLALQYASEELKSDRKFVLDAVRQNGLVLQYTLKEFKSNREVVATAVQENGCALEYVSKILKSDKEVVLAAMQQTGRALKYASESIIRDKAFVLAALENNPWSLEHVSQDFKNDKEVVLAAVKRNGFVLCYASKELKSDRDIVLAAVQQNGLAFKYAAEELKNDKEIIQAALEQNSMSMGGVSNYERELKSQF
ncbi:MAG: DUF4116 domain-containing protein, partial [Parachlamydiaceae bacterium]